MVDVINNPAIALYVATGVALVVMLGFFIYLWRMDRRVRELQQALDREIRAEARPDATGTARIVDSEPLRPQRIEKELSNGLDRG